MKPISFPGQNIVFGENQPQYQPLPALVIDGPEMETISCWGLSDDEIDTIVKNKCFYLSQYRFGNMIDGVFIPNSLQPILPMAELGDNLKLTL